MITEHGWPTGPGRTPQRQAEVLRTVIDVISRNAEELRITGYIHHTLRDACSAGAGLLCQFGLMTDDYAPKPAFHVYRELIDAAGRARARARPMSTSEERRRRATSGMRVQTDSAVSPFGSGRSWPPVIRIR